MNKYMPITIAIVLVIFISGCVEEDINISIFGLDIGPTEPVYTRFENIKIEAEAIPSEVYEGRNTTLFFDVYNTGNTTLENIDLQVTDSGYFESTETSKHIDKLEEGETEGWSWKLNTRETEIHSEIDQTVRYTLSYESTSNSLYDVVVMSEDEYVRLERGGTLDEIELFYYKTKSPVETDISISKEQPLFEGLEFYLYVTLKDMGGGTINNINPGELFIYYPNFLEFVESNDFKLEEEGKLGLKRSLNFYNKESKKTACKFKVVKTDIRNTGQFRAEANYIYEYHETINIKIKPK
jgi:hypothetical protein